MAQNLNYRINLVIEPKNVIRANRELQAMERYFERIQGRVLKIGRTRMMPEVVLKDNASAGLERILNKLNQVKSRMINASGTFSMKVTQSGEMSVKGLEPLALKLDANTNALSALTEVMKQKPSGTSGTGNTAKKPETWYEKTASAFADMKNLGSGVKSTGSAIDNIKNFRERFVNSPAGGPPRSKLGKILGVAHGVGTVMSDIGDAGSNLIGTLGKMGDGASGLFKGLLGNSEKLIGGPAGIALDVASIVTAGSGKERAQAIGSTVGGLAGGSVGSMIGSAVLPGIGTAVGGMVGSMVGDFVGGKVGGFIADTSPVIKEKVSEVTNWLSDKTSGIREKVSNFFSWNKTEAPVKKETPAQPAVPPTPVVPSAVTPAVYPAISPMNTGAMPSPLIALPPGLPTALPPGSPMAGTTVNPMLSAAAANRIPGKPVVPSAVTPAVYPAISPMNTGAMPSPLIALPAGLPTALPPGSPMAGTTVNPMFSAAAANRIPGEGAKGIQGAKASQLVQISPEQMSTLGTYLKDFKTETTNHINVNFPAGAVQMTVHENTLDIGSIVAQVAAKLDAELRKATQNRKPVMV